MQTHLGTWNTAAPGAPGAKLASVMSRHCARDYTMRSSRAVSRSETAAAFIAACPACMSATDSSAGEGVAAVRQASRAASAPQVASSISPAQAT